MTNVVFPSGPNDSDGDPEYLLPFLATIVALAGVLVTIGARDRRRDRGDGHSDLPRGQ
jgi:hypothetical protein